MKTRLLAVSQRALLRRRVRGAGVRLREVKGLVGPGSGGAGVGVSRVTACEAGVRRGEEGGRGLSRSYDDSGGAGRELANAIELLPHRAQPSVELAVEGGSAGRVPGVGVGGGAGSHGEDWVRASEVGEAGQFVRGLRYRAINSGGDVAWSSCVIWLPV